MRHSQCSICRKNEAEKTNSHLIPSFLLTMVSSADHSGRRDTEMLYTIGPNITKAYIGRKVPQIELEKNFNELSDERINELSKHNAAKDYIFCPHCEKLLGNLLEAPYFRFLFQGQKVPSEVPYLFWLSVIWRISFYNVFGEVKLKTHQEASLRNRLYGYFQAKETNSDICHLFDNLPFQYRMLYCQGYSKEGSGFQYGRYEAKNKVLSIFLGDIILCVHFGSTELSDNYAFYGLEQHFRQTPLNDGSQSERHFDITSKTLKESAKLLMDELQAARLKANRKHIIEFWKQLRHKVPLLPIEPEEKFIESCIYHLYNDDDKIGEKITNEHYAKAIANAFKDVYGIDIK